MGKRNIYFDEDLDRAIGEHPEINWSAVCQEAVRQRLEEGDPPTVGRRVERLEVALTMLADAAMNHGQPFDMRDKASEALMVLQSGV